MGCGTEASRRPRAHRAPLSLALHARTLRGTFGANFASQVRGYTTTGWLFSTLLSPIFLLAGAAVVQLFLTGGAAPPRFVELTGYSDYLTFVILGLAVNGLVLSALEDGGTAIHGEEQEGTWDLVALTPMNRFVWMSAKTLAGLVTSFVDFAIVLAIGAAAFGLTIHPAGIPAALVGLVATLLALQGVAFLMAALGLVWKEPYSLAMLLSPVLVFASGMLFPIEALPGWVQAIGNAIPLTHGLRILRDALLLGSGFGELAPRFGMLALTGGAFMLVGYAAFRFMEKRARRLGVLGRY